MTIDHTDTDTDRRIPLDQAPLERPPDSTDDSEFQRDTAVGAGHIGDPEQALADRPARDAAPHGLRTTLPGAVAG
jgi:hypothetical protein